MSKKKYKKRHSQDVINAKRQANQAKLADEKAKAQKRMKPAARNLLLGNLVFLAAAQFLTDRGLISEAISAGCTLLGIALLILALWIQFKKKGDDDKFYTGNWPGMR